MKLYTLTGIFSSLLLAIFIAFLVLLGRKRLFKTPNIKDTDEDLGRKASIKISEPVDPWSSNEKLKQAYPGMIKSHVWFDSLQR